MSKSCVINDPKQFRYRLLDRNITITELSSQVGISRQRMHDFLNGSLISGEKVSRICTILDFSVKELGMMPMRDTVRMWKLERWDTLGRRPPLRRREFYSTGEIAKAFSVSKYTIYDWMRNHDMPFEKMATNRYYFRWPLVFHWAEDIIEGR